MVVGAAMSLHRPGCICYYCEEDAKIAAARAAEESAAEEFEPDEWEEPTRLDPGPAAEFAADGEITAKMAAYPELAHLAEDSAQDATRVALGAMMDALLERGIPEAGAILSRALELLKDRRSRIDVPHKSGAA